MAPAISMCGILAKSKTPSSAITIVEEVRSRHTAALPHLPDPALRLLQIQVSVTVMLTGIALVEMGYDKEQRV